MPEPVHGNGRYVKSGHASPLPRRSATRHFPAPWARSPRTNAVVLRLGDVLVTAEQPCDLDVSGAATQLVNRRVAQVVHRVAGESGRHDAARARLVKRCPAFAETRIGLAHERLAPLDLPLCGGNFLHPFGRAGGGGVAPGTRLQRVRVRRPRSQRSLLSRAGAAALQGRDERLGRDSDRGAPAADLNGRDLAEADLPPHGHRVKPELRDDRSTVSSSLR